MGASLVADVSSGDGVPAAECCVNFDSDDASLTGGMADSLSGAGVGGPVNLAVGGATSIGTFPGGVFDSAVGGWLPGWDSPEAGPLTGGGSVGSAGFSAGADAECSSDVSSGLFFRDIRKGMGVDSEAGAGFAPKAGAGFAPEAGAGFAPAVGAGLEGAEEGELPLDVAVFFFNDKRFFGLSPELFSVLDS